MKSIGEIISVIRKENGFTQEELGKKAGLSRVAIAKIENNQRAISLEEAINISKVFKISVDELYGLIKEESSAYEVNKEAFVKAFKLKGVDDEKLNEVKRIELLVDMLFTQEQIRGE